MRISRTALRLQKKSGSYGCPHFINPACASDLLSHRKVAFSEDAALVLAEIMENFGDELITTIRGPVTRESLLGALDAIEFTE